SFRNSTGVKYRYRLKGYDDEWTETRQSLANYTNLPAGNYEFQLHAANADEVWTAEPLILDFSIRQHFTETIWFILTCFLLSFGLIAALVLIYVRRQKARAALDRQIVESEQKALRAQINPHFVFNAMNSIQYFITENDKHNAGVFLSRFSKLMRRILDNSKKNWITLEEEISATRHYLGIEKLRFGERFSYELLIEPGVDPYETEIPSMITQPFLENAIWHGLMPKEEPGRLTVRFFREKGDLICEITDDGIGREQAAAIRRNKRHNSTGITNVTERIELLNKLYNTQMSVYIDDLKDEEGRALGTRVRINLGKLPQ
ncbi:MAG: histidine kinase, partial [Phaeodactylibacter sp.]|nr:histidine kinase [Phaeodactylibacter sp.]